MSKRKRDPNIWEYVDFSPIQHDILKRIAKALSITFSGAVEYSLDGGLVPFYCVVVFFKHRIEASPGSRVSHEDLWSAFQAWFHPYGLKWQINAYEFAAMGHEICYYKKIALRVRGNQVYCLDVRLKQASIPSKKEGAG